MKCNKRISIIMIAFIILAVTPLWGVALALKDSMGITIDGYMSELAWESSAMKSFTLSSGKKAFLRLLADKKGIYVGVLVSDFTQDDSDNISVSVSGIGGSHSIKISRAGSKLSGSGTYAVDNSSIQYTAECKFPASISGAGTVNATLTVMDDGNKNSGSTSLSLTVPTTTTTTKPTTTTTTKAPEKPNTPTTRPSSGGNNNITIGGNSGSGGNSSGGSSTLPPAGGTTAEGATSGGTITGTDSSGATITTTEGETITAPGAIDENTANRWLLIIAIVFGLALVGMLIYVFILHSKRKDGNDHQDESKEE